MSEFGKQQARNAGRMLLSNTAVRPAAEAMAGSHPRALDYLRQAPVLALAAAPYGCGRIRSSEGMFIAATFAEFCERGARLREVMGAYGLSLQLRALHPFVLRPTQWPIIKRLSTVRPSILAQAIPERPGAQLSWLRAIGAWSERLGRREGDPWRHFEWAVTRFSGAGRGGEAAASDIADLAIQMGSQFVPAWTLSEAQRATERWHRELAARSDHAEFAKTMGLGFSDPVDYDPLPLTADISGFAFSALRSGEDLFIEGRAMRHCVASYMRQVLSGRSRIYSIRSGDDRRVATLELQYDRGSWKTVQLQGPCGTPVPIIARRAAQEFERQIADASRTSALASIGLFNRAPNARPEARA